MQLCVQGGCNEWEEQGQEQPKLGAHRPLVSARAICHFTFLAARGLLFAGPTEPANSRGPWPRRPSNSAARSSIGSGWN
jgi:hypothetical protein